MTSIPKAITQLPKYNVKRKYYKWVPWTRPNLTSNSSFGWLTGGGAYNGDAGNRAYFKMFDGVLTDGKANHWGTPNVTTGWWMWTLPLKLKITKLILHSIDYYTTTTDFVIQGKFFSDSTKTNQIGQDINISARYTVLEVDLGDGIETSVLYFQKTGGGYYSGFKEVEIEAQYLIEVPEGEDYDFYTENPVYYSQQTEHDTKQYYKISYTPWNKPGSPTVTSDTSDPEFVIHASSEHSASHYSHFSFQNKSGANPWISAEVATAWYQITFQKPIKITAVHMLNRSSKYDTGSGMTFVFQARNSAEENWVDVTPRITNTVTGQGAKWSFYPKPTKGYKQYRWNFTARSSAYYSIGFPTFEWYEEIETSCLATDNWDGFHLYPLAGMTAITYPELKYYKRGLEPNILRLDTAGTAVIENGIITNVNAASRLCLPKAPVNVKSYEIQIKFKAVAFNDGRLIGNYKTNVRSPQIELPADITQDAATALWFGHPGASDAWTGITLTTKLEFDTYYWVRAIWTGTATQLWLSTDGINFNLEGSNISTACYWTEQFLFGVDVDGYAIDPNTRIDLKESYIKINNEIWWRGTFSEECSEAEAEWSEWINTDKPIN